MPRGVLSDRHRGAQPASEQARPPATVGVASARPSPVVHLRAGGPVNSGSRHASVSRPPQAVVR
eukprot:1449610-Alexandrium_andersonii.AAC.1